VTGVKNIISKKMPHVNYFF